MTCMACKPRACLYARENLGMPLLRQHLSAASAAPGGSPAVEYSPEPHGAGS